MFQQFGLGGKPQLGSKCCLLLCPLRDSLHQRPLDIIRMMFLSIRKRPDRLHNDILS
jgi:hypothetical protein